MSNLLDSLDHITVLTKNLELTKDFYIKILGMEIDNNRPPFKFEGVWLSLNERAVVHIVVTVSYTHLTLPTILRV